MQAKPHPLPVPPPGHERPDTNDRVRVRVFEEHGERTRVAHAEISSTKRLADGSEATQRITSRFERLYSLLEQAGDILEKQRKRELDRDWNAAVEMGFKVEKLRARVFEKVTGEGRTPYVELSHTKTRPDGTQATIRFECSFDKIFKQLKHAEQILKQRREQQHPQQWHAVVKLDELTEKGARVRVVSSFDDIDAALAFSRKTEGLALYKESFAKRPADGQTFELRPGESERVDRLSDEARWRERQMKYYGVGVWFDKDAQPRAGQLVRLTVGRDYRGSPDDCRVSPPHGLNPGEPREQRFIVFEKSEHVQGRGRIVAIAKSDEQALRYAKLLNNRRLEIEKVLDPQQWRRQDFSPELRQSITQEQSHSHGL